MTYEYEIHIRYINPRTYAYYQDKGWTELWKIDIFYKEEESRYSQDIANAPGDWLAADESRRRSDYYMAPTKAEAQAKAEQIARDHAAKLKAERLAPVKYKYTVD